MKLLSRDFTHCYPDIFVLSGTTFSLLKRGPISACNSVVSCELFLSLHSAYFVCITAVKLNSRENQFALSPRRRFLSRHICSLVASNEFFPLFCEIESEEERGRGNLAIDFMEENGMRCVRLQTVARFEISERLAEIWNFSKSDKSLFYIVYFLR